MARTELMIVWWVSRVLYGKCEVSAFNDRKSGLGEWTQIRCWDLSLKDKDDIKKGSNMSDCLRLLTTYLVSMFLSNDK